MKIACTSLTPTDFEGLQILDYTAGRDLSSSIAQITVPPGVRHRTAWSRRSDKYYVVLDGTLSFTLGDDCLDLDRGDCCIVPRGTRFGYRNSSGAEVRLLLVHSPSFDLSEEIFEDDDDT